MRKGTFKRYALDELDDSFIFQYISDGWYVYKKDQLYYIFDKHGINIDTSTGWIAAFGRSTIEELADILKIVSNSYITNLQKKLIRINRPVVKKDQFPKTLTLWDSFLKKEIEFNNKKENYILKETELTEKSLRSILSGSCAFRYVLVDFSL